MALSWCDKLASRPAVGLNFQPHHVPGPLVLSALSPLLDQWVDGQKPTFNIRKQEPFSVELATDDGFFYGITPNRMFVEFEHRLKLKPVSGAPPTVEMISQPQPFTKLLPVVADRLRYAASLLTTTKPRILRRIGIVSSTLVDANDAPPGIVRFIDYVTRPWSNSLDQYSFQMTTPLHQDNACTDRCIHVISKPEDPDELVTIKFDWQRTFKTARDVSEKTLKDLMEDAQADAVKYFEDLAEGNRFDENIVCGKN